MEKYKVKIESVGEDAAIVFPPEIVKHLNVVVGDMVSIRQTPSGFEIVRVDQTPATDSKNEWFSAYEFGIQQLRPSLIDPLVSSIGSTSCATRNLLCYNDLHS